MIGISAQVMRATSGPARWAQWLPFVAGGWALFYAAYRGYYALGGTVGMFGTPISMAQWRLINAVGAAIILVGAVLPIAIMPLWHRRGVRWVLLALCWVAAVGCVMHALVDITTRILSLAGVLQIDFPPFWASIDRREADWQDLLFNEPWFLVEGLLWGALGWFGLTSDRGRRLWLTSSLLATVALTVLGLLSAAGVIGKFVIA